MLYSLILAPLPATVPHGRLMASLDLIRPAICDGPDLVGHFVLVAASLWPGFGRLTTDAPDGPRYALHCEDRGNVLYLFCIPLSFVSFGCRSEQLEATHYRTVAQAPSLRRPPVTHQPASISGRIGTQFSRVRHVFHPGNRLCAARRAKTIRLVTAAFCFGLASHVDRRKSRRRCIFRMTSPARRQSRRPASSLDRTRILRASVHSYRSNVFPPGRSGFALMLDLAETRGGAKSS
jgi:hypothetical protein